MATCRLARKVFSFFATCWLFGPSSKLDSAMGSDRYSRLESTSSGVPAPYRPVQGRHFVRLAPETPLSLGVRYFNTVFLNGTILR